MAREQPVCLSRVAKFHGLWDLCYLRIMDPKAVREYIRILLWQATEINYFKRKTLKKHYCWKDIGQLTGLKEKLNNHL